jgi:hypothetical protein
LYEQTIQDGNWAAGEMLKRAKQEYTVAANLLAELFTYSPAGNKQAKVVLYTKDILTKLPGTTLGILFSGIPSIPCRIYKTTLYV